MPIGVFLQKIMEAVKNVESVLLPLNTRSKTNASCGAGDKKNHRLFSLWRYFQFPKCAQLKD